MKKLVKNMAKCLICGDIIESKTVHDMKSCKCKALSVDGGLAYIRRSFINKEDFEELSVYEEVDEE